MALGATMYVFTVELADSDRVYRDSEFIGIGEVRADGRLYAKRLLSY